VFSYQLSINSVQLSNVNTISENFYKAMLVLKINKLSFYLLASILNIYRFWLCKVLVRKVIYVNSSLTSIALVYRNYH